MRISLLAIGTRMPAWVEQGVEDYRRRLPREWRFRLVELQAARRTPGMKAERAMEIEAQRIERATPKGARLVALDERGDALSTAGLAKRIDGWSRQGTDIALVIGGADGLAPALRDGASARWSLSPLTLPHALVRVVVVEQLYRAHSLSTGHPYHRE